MESYHRYNNDEQIQVSTGCTQLLTLFLLLFLQIPQRLQEQVLELETRTQELLAQGEQKLINHIPVLLHSWNEFQSQLDELSRCVDMACSELDSLRVFPDFLIEFDALHSRHQVGVVIVSVYDIIFSCFRCSTIVYKNTNLFSSD